MNYKLDSIEYIGGRHILLNNHRITLTDIAKNKKRIIFFEYLLFSVGRDSYKLP